MIQKIFLIIISLTTHLTLELCQTAKEKEVVIQSKHSQIALEQDQKKRKRN